MYTIHFDSQLGYYTLCRDDALLLLSRNRYLVMRHYHVLSGKAIPERYLARDLQ